MIDIMAYVSCSTDKKGPIVFSNSPRRTFVLCIILVAVFWAILLNCPRHAYRLYIAISFEAKTGSKTPFLLFISNYLLNLQRFTQLSAIPLHEIFTSLRQFCVLQKRIKNEILEQYVYLIDMPNTSFIIFHAFTNKEEISINFILDKSFEFFFDQIILVDELRNEILTELKRCQSKRHLQTWDPQIKHGKNT